MIPNPSRLSRSPDLALALTVGCVQRGVFFYGMGEGTHFYCDLGAGGGGAVAEACGADVAPGELGEGGEHDFFGGVGSWGREMVG